MFEVIVTACIAASGICQERLLPLAAPSPEACMGQAKAHAAAWAERHELTVSDVRCAQSNATAALAVREVAPGVFTHRGQTSVPTPSNAGDLANLGFVVGEEAVAVIDAGGSRQVAERLYAAIRTQTDLPIRWLILTHMHPDHTLGASVFKEAGARILGHRNLALALADRASTYTVAMERLMGSKAYLGTRPVAPDIAEIHEIDIGGRVLAIESHETAHSNADLTVFDRETGTLFTGDLIFVHHIPALDGSILGWQAVLERMTDKEEIRQIVPGHGPIPLPWPQAAESTRAYLATLADETRAAIAAGHSMRKAITHLGESQRRYWQLFDEFNKRNATAAYKELEWE